MTNEERDTLLQTMAGDIGEIKTTIAVSNEKVGRHDKSLYGNGTPGLMTRVQKIEDAHESKDKGIANIIAWIGVIAAVAMAGIALVR